MTLQKFIMLLKDPDPCEECLVKAICKTTCMNKSKWEGRTKNFFAPFMIVFAMWLLLVSFFAYGIALLAFKFNLITYEQTQRLNIFPDWEEPEDDYYY